MSHLPVNVDGDKDTGLLKIHPQPTNSSIAGGGGGLEGQKQAIMSTLYEDKQGKGN